MSHSWGKKISGQCIDNQSANFVPFKEFCVHLISTTFATPGSQSSTYYCGTNGFTTDPGTEFFPNFVLPSSNVYQQPVYGTTTDTVALTSQNIPVFFNDSQLTPWKQRDVYQPNTQMIYAEGPALQDCHAAFMLRRRLAPFNDNYQNRYAYDFVEAPSDYGGIYDWLSFTHPATYVFANKNVSEPFSGTKYYEQTGSTPPYNSTYAQNFIPFCETMPVYKQDGFLLGEYVGYSFIFIFNQNAVTIPINPYVPDRPYAITPPAAPVTTTRQFFSMEVLWYMVGKPITGQVLQSPLLNRKRFWAYNNCNQIGTCGAGVINMANPYFYIDWTGGITSQWNFDVVFQLLGGGNTTLKFALDNLHAYVTP